MEHNNSAAIPTRKRWGVVAMFVVVGAIGPLAAHGTEGGNMGWGWFALFILNALFAAFTDVFF